MPPSTHWNVAEVDWRVTPGGAGELLAGAGLNVGERPETAPWPACAGAATASTAMTAARRPAFTLPDVTPLARSLQDRVRTSPPAPRSGLGAGRSPPRAAGTRRTASTCAGARSRGVPRWRG